MLCVFLCSHITFRFLGTTPQALIQYFWREAQEPVFLISSPADFDWVVCGLYFEMT